MEETGAVAGASRIVKIPDLDLGSGSQIVQIPPALPAPPALPTSLTSTSPAPTAQPSTLAFKSAPASTPAAPPFSALEDFLLWTLDSLCPFDSRFISEHTVGRDQAAVTARLNHSDYWQQVRQFKKLPLFTFEIIFVRGGDWVSRSLVLLTAKRLIPLTCTKPACIHEFSIPQVGRMSTVIELLLTAN